MSKTWTCLPAKACQQLIDEQHNSDISGTQQNPIKVPKIPNRNSFTPRM
jgi:hypothetical protein